MKIKLDQLLPNPEQPRLVIDRAELESLAESIREHGLLNPIAVEGPQEDGKYYIIDGERRWRAHILAGIEEIECHVRPALNGSGNIERLLLGIIGNLQRQDMNMIERAQGYKRLRDLGLTYQEIGKDVNMTPSMIGENIKLLALPLEIQELYAAGKLPFDVRLIRMWIVLDADKAVSLARRAASAGMTTKRILYLAEKLNRFEPEKQKANNPDQGSVARANKIFMARAAAGGHWNALAQLRLYGCELPNDRLQTAAVETCKVCALYDDASQNVCRDCPAVDLLRRLNVT